MTTEVTDKRISETYGEMYERHWAEMKKIPMGYALTEKDYEAGLQELGVGKKEITWLSDTAAFVRTKDAPQLKEMLDRHAAEEEAAIEADETGEGFIRTMFAYELADNEYCITKDITDTLEALDLTLEQVNADPRLKRGLELGKIDALANK